MSHRRLPLASAYDTLQSAHGELASIQPRRSRSSRILRSTPSGKPEIDDALYPEQTMQPQVDGLYLRDLEYLDPDSHLSCPICHVTFIDPVSVQCGHYFCAECLVKYWTITQRPGERLPCPTCRTTVTSTASAPRVIINMCNDVNVKCPSEGCGKIMSRGELQTHVMQYCTERAIFCLNDGCKEKIKRKHHVLGLCRHATHTECACGDLVLSEEMESHEEADCSLRKVECIHCRQPISPSDSASHECEPKEHCPGQDFGCDVYLNPSALEAHAKTCTMAKMTPYLKTHVANSLAPIQEQLSQSQQRVKGLEEGIDKLFEAIESATHELQQSRREEAPHRPSSPNTQQAAITDHQNPSDPSPSTTTTTTISDPDPPTSSSSASHRHLLALHENLRAIVTDLSLNQHHLTHRIEEGHAQNSMVCLNDRLRLEEQLSMMSNALFSTRTQVQWLLNRERTLGAGGAGQQQQQQQQQQAAAVRGRALAATVVGVGAQEPGAGANGNGNGSEYAAAAAGTGPGIGIGMAGLSLRPAARRTSGGGSQERVKL